MVHRRARPVGDRQRRHRQHEFPPVSRSRRFGQGVEIRAVDQVNAQNRQNEIMQRNPVQVSLGLRHVPGRLPAEKRDISLLQPWDDGIIQSGRSFIDRPRP
jgi:hypothetical protein